jgi:hypothetical protein
MLLFCVLKSFHNHQYYIIINKLKGIISGCGKIRSTKNNLLCKTNPIFKKEKQYKLLLKKELRNERKLKHGQNKPIQTLLKDLLNNKKNPGHHWLGFLMFKYLLRVNYIESPEAAASLVQPEASLGQPEAAFGQEDLSLSQQGLSQASLHVVAASAPSAYADAWITSCSPASFALAPSDLQPKMKTRPAKITISVSKIVVRLITKTS